MIYIPTEEQRIKVYEKIDENNPNVVNVPQQTPAQDYKMLTKKQTQSLINRLYKETKRENKLYHQVKIIKDINIERKNRQKQASKVQQRLINEGKKLQDKKEKMKMNSMMEEDKLLKKKPSISEYAKGKSQKKPFLERVDNIQDGKQILMKKLMKKYEPSFQPQINPHSKFIADIQNDENLDFIHRIQAYQKNKKEKLQQLQLEKLNDEANESQFHPQINPMSRIIAENLSKREKPKEKSKVSRSTKELQFRPKINSKSVQIVQKCETRKTICYDRLYDDVKKLSVRKQELRKERQSLYNFKPKLNEKSLKMCKGKQSMLIEDEAYEEVFAEGSFLFEEEQPSGESLFQEFLNRKKEKSSKVTSVE